MLPECFQVVLKDMEIYDDQKGVIQHRLLDDSYIREKMVAYIHKLSKDDIVYERFMKFLRIYQQPLEQVFFSKRLVQNLIEAFQQSIEVEVIYKRLHDVIYYSLSILDVIIALRQRSFVL